MSKQRALIVDDDVILAELCRCMLEASGMIEAIVVNDGTHAYQAAREFKPDIIILDVTLPDCDGREIAAELQSDSEFADVAITFMTGMVTRQQAAERIFSGGLPMISKPFLGSEFIRFAQSAIEEKAQERRETRPQELEQCSIPAELPLRVVPAC